MCHAYIDSLCPKHSRERKNNGKYGWWPALVGDESPPTLVSLTLSKRVEIHPSLCPQPLYRGASGIEGLVWQILV
jgi:hypothetical protein